MTDCRYCSMIAGGEHIIASNDSAVAILERSAGGAERIVVLSRRHEPAFFTLEDSEQLAVIHMAYDVALTLAESDPRVSFKLEIPCALTLDEETAHAQVLVLTEIRPSLLAKEVAFEATAEGPNETASAERAVTGDTAVGGVPAETGEAGAPTAAEATAEDPVAEGTDAEGMTMAERCLAIGVDYGRLSRIYTDEQLEGLLGL